MVSDGNHPALSDNPPIRPWLTAQECGQWTCGRMVNDTHKWECMHNDGNNIGFADGHVKWLSIRELGDSTKEYWDRN